MNYSERIQKLSAAQRASLKEKLAAIDQNENHDAASSKRLVAYIISQGSASAAELREFLQKKLPDYMVPSPVVFLPSFPQTPNGKVDRNALPEPEQVSAENEKAFAAPCTPIEIQLANIWSTILRVDKVGLHDDFFELGGHSLLAIQIIARVRDTFQVEIPLRTIFETRTVATLAETIVQTLAQADKSSEMDDLLSELDGMTDEEAQQLLTSDR